MVFLFVLAAAAPHPAVFLDRVVLVSNTADQNLFKRYVRYCCINSCVQDACRAFEIWRLH